MNNAERRRRTREALLEAAAQEFEAYGYEKTTLQGVADRLGLTRGTVLFHFHTKEALRDTLVAWCDERLCATMAGSDGRGGGVHMLTKVADMHHEDARIRAGLLLYDEEARRGVKSRMEWEKSLEVCLKATLGNDPSEMPGIRVGAVADMYVAIMRSDRWKDERQLHQALGFLFSLTGLKDAEKRSDSAS